LVKRESINIACLRKGQWGNLLNKPVLRDVLSNAGSGCLEKQVLSDLWFPRLAPFVLTLGEWGNERSWSWNQTSRPGKNLVLQLNLPESWSKRFFELTQEKPNAFFSAGHPVSNTRSVTLAWARLDVDFDTDEVLVEEIQSDLVHDINRLQLRAMRSLKSGREQFWYYCDQIDAKKMLAFSTSFLEYYQKIWQEVMLAATLEFVFDELGISNVYYHSFDTGNALKNLKYSKPPRSLYTSLPKKFCFSKTKEAPTFLKQEKRLKRKLKKLKDGRWFHMAA